MPQIIKSISISPKEEEFLEKNHISPTFLIRKKLQEMIEWQNMGGGLKQVEEMTKKIKRLVETIEKYSEFLNKKGLLEEYSKL